MHMHCGPECPPKLQQLSFVHNRLPTKLAYDKGP